jgi:phage terminase small subunit
MYAGKRSKAGREAAARSKDEEVFEVQGGTGFDPHRPPHESCPHCHGHGQGRTLLKDTRTLGYEASLLFDGVKETKDGLEVKMVDRMAALEKLMRHLGAYDADNRQKKPDDGLAELLRRVSGPRAALPINPDPQD